MADDTVDKFESDVEEIEELEAKQEEEQIIVSPYWKEFHAEDVLIFSNYYGIRLVFVDYPPKKFFTGSPGHFVNRKVDILMPKEAFLEFADYVADIANMMETKEIEEVKEPEKPENIEE